MRAMVIERYGAPLVLRDIPSPTPGPGEVLVRVLGCGVCRTDLKIAAGAMPFSATLPLPHVPGHEISGEIAALGPGARARVGDRVVVFNYWACGRCAHCQAGDETLCERLRGWVGFTSPGGFQEYLVAPDDCVLPLPDAVRPEHGGPLSCALGTAYHAAVSRGAVRAGEAVAVVGAGGVGLHIVQVARAAGAAVFAVDVQPHRLEAARAAGADAAFLTGDDAVAGVRLATGGRGADLVLDTVGHHDSVLAAADLVRAGGRIVLIGYTGRAEEYPPLPTQRVVLGQLTLMGSRYVTRLELRRALDLVARGLVRPVISGEVPLERANEALAMVRDDQATGRVIVRVGGARA
jgi:alcohol dehydrogenase